MRLRLSPVTADATRSRILLLAAALLWSIGGVLAKSPWIVEIPLDSRGMVVACYRTLFAAGVLAPFVSWRRVRWHRGLIAAAASFAAMNILYLTALTRTTAAAAIFLQYTAVAWAVILGRVFLRERPARADWIALAFAVCGIASIVLLETTAQHTAGNLIGLASGVAYAAVIVSLRGLRGEDPVWVLMLSNLATGLCLLPWVASRSIELRAAQWAVLAVFGIVQVAVPYLLFAIAMRRVPAHEAALLTLIEAVLNPIWVWLLVGERASTATWIGGGLILLGLLVQQQLRHSQRSHPAVNAEPSILNDPDSPTLPP